MADLHLHQGPSSGGRLENYVRRDVTLPEALLTRESFAWSPGSVPSGEAAVAYLPLTNPGVIVGVKFPNTPQANTYFRWGDANSPGGGVRITNTGNQQAMVAFENESGSAVDPGTVTIWVYYLKTQSGGNSG